MGNNVGGDSENFEHLFETARRGNTVGMLYLSLAYEFGDGVAADMDRARQIRSDAGAIMGNARAKAALLKARAQWAATSKSGVRSRLGAISHRLLPSRSR